MGEEKVKIHSTSTVVPSKAVAPGKCYPLSNLDHMMRLHNVRLVYYYKKFSNKASLDLISNLKISLSAVLSSYPAVCGRLQTRDDGNWEIKCTDAGVRALEATVDSTLENWLQTADRSAELGLCHWEGIGSDLYISSLVYVQFNEFEGGGLAIGISCGHMLADPSCLTLMMKAWGETHRRAQVLHPPFFHPPGLKARANKNNETTATRYYETTFKQEVSTSLNFRTVTFKFSHDMVQQCISQVESGSHKYQGVTAFEALSALFWAACSKAKDLPRS